MPQHEYLTLRTPVTDAKRIIMMRLRDKYPWSRVTYEMGLSKDVCKSRMKMYYECIQRLNAMTLREIAVFLRTHETFHQRYLGEPDARIRHTNGRRGRKASRV